MKFEVKVKNKQSQLEVIKMEGTDIFDLIKKLTIRVMSEGYKDWYSIVKIGQ